METKPNFKNPKTGEEFFVGRHKMTVRNEKVVYMDKNGRPLQDEDGTLLEPIKHEVDFGVPYIGTFKGLSDAEKNKVMHKRSLEHDKRTSQKENWHNINMNIESNS